jgi:hypothetical protein
VLVLVVKVAVAFGFVTDVGNSAFGKKLLTTHRVNILVISNFHAINVLDKQIYKNID